MTKLSAERLALIRDLEMPIGVKVVRALFDHIAAVEAERDALAKVADKASEGPCRHDTSHRGLECPLCDALRAAGYRR